MKLEDKIISLEIALKLAKLSKDKGVELPKSEYYWEKEVSNDFKWHIVKGQVDWLENSEGENCAKAYDVAELGEMLPDNIISRRYSKEAPEILYLVSEKGDGRLFEDKTEADTRAKMVIYLIENGYIKIGAEK